MWGAQKGQKASPPAWVFPSYTGLDLMTSCESLPVPLVYGFAKLSPNIIYQNNFNNHPILQYTGQQWIITGYTYSVDLLLALCEGPISNIGQVWQNNSTTLYSSSSPNPYGWSLSLWGSNNGKGSSGTTLFTGAPGQVAWSYLTTNNPSYALAYQGLAYLGAATFNLGESASIGTLNFEIAAILYGTGANGVDADPARVIQDFLTDTNHGVPGFPSSALDTSTLLGSSGDSSVQSYCAALGLCFSPALVQQEAANSILTRWCQLLNLGAVWTGGMLRFVPYGDMNITGATVNWTAQTSPQYALTEDQFGAGNSDESPVSVERSDPLSLFNVQRLEVLNRAGVNVNTALVAARVAANTAQMVSLLTHGVESGQGAVAPIQGQPQYQATPVEARDLNSAQIIGLRVAPTVNAHEICDLNVASVVAQTLLQRGLYVRNRFSFTLSFVFCLLDPMDVVSLTYPLLGLNGALVRITEIEEQEDASLKITAEELTIGVSTPGPNPTSGTGSTTIDQNIAADLVGCAVVYKPPTTATGGVSQLWICASGGLTGVPDANFGGADVMISVDGGSTYNQFGSVNGAAEIGTLTAGFATGSGWDTANTISVNLTASGGVLTSTTMGNAQSGAANLILIGSELIAFETATLIGQNLYNLTGLQRGLFGTTAAAHAAGASFSLFANVAIVAIQPGWSSLLVKLQAFNTWNNGLNALSSCFPIPFSIGSTGSAYINTASSIVALSGSSVTTSGAMGQIPAGATLLSVVVTVESAVSGPSGIYVDPQYLANGSAGGVGGAYGTCGVAIGASLHFQTSGSVWTSASGIKLTANGGTGSFSGGSARVAITYYLP